MSLRDKEKGPRVALYRGDDRIANLRLALASAGEQIDWAACRRVLVKPNLVSRADPWAITHPAALEAVLQGVRARYSGDLVVAEGCAGEPTLAAMRASGYEAAAARYGAALLDLNADEAIPATIYDARGRPLTVRLARSVVESDCRISLAVPKTHDAVLVTLGIKNMVMGSVVSRRAAGGEGRPAWRDKLGQVLHGHGNGWGSDKHAMHQGIPMLNVNLALLAGLVWPHLTIMDGFMAMEGNGPVGGAPVPWGVALAGADALAVDALAAEMMGFPARQVGYLRHIEALGLGCAERDAIQVLGNARPEEVARALTPHATHAQQRRWDDLVARRVLDRFAGQGHQ